MIDRISFLPQGDMEKEVSRVTRSFRWTIALTLCRRMRTTLKLAARPAWKIPNARRRASPPLLPASS